MSTDPQEQLPAESESADAPRTDQPPETMEFYFTKSRFCRAVYADGAYGGITAKKNIWTAIYSEHTILPQSITYDISTLSSAVELTRNGPTGVQREVEVEIIMDKAAASSLRDWLDARIKQLDAFEATGTLTDVPE